MQIPNNKETQRKQQMLKNLMQGSIKNTSVEYNQPTHSVLPENRIQLKPGSGVTLPLFADCHQLLTDEMKAEIDRVKRGENPEEMKAKIKAEDRKSVV